MRRDGRRLARYPPVGGATTVLALAGGGGGGCDTAADSPAWDCCVVSRRSGAPDTSKFGLRSTSRRPWQCEKKMEWEIPPPPVRSPSQQSAGSHEHNLLTVCLLQSSRELLNPPPPPKQKQKQNTMNATQVRLHHHLARSLELSDTGQKYPSSWPRPSLWPVEERLVSN